MMIILLYDRQLQYNVRLLAWKKLIDISDNSFKVTDYKSVKTKYTIS